MYSHSGGGFQLPGAATVRLVGGTAADRDELRRRLEAVGMSIATGTDASASRESEPAITAGVIRIRSDGVDASEPIGPGTTDSTDTGGDDPEPPADIPEPSPEPPQVVVGPDVDVAAAYEAGASLVIPLAVADLPDTAIDRIADHLRRTGTERVAADLLDHAPAGVTVVDPETGAVLGCTDRCSALVRQDPAATVELSDLAACGDHTESELVELVRQAAAGAEATAEFHDLPADAPADCLEVTFESATVAGEEFVIGWVKDVTERTERREERQRYETILDSLDDAVYATAPDGTIEYVNKKYASMKGVDRETILGTSIYEWVDEEAAERAKEIRRQLQEGELDVGRLEYEFRSADGETTPAEIRFVTMSTDSDAVGGAGVIRDISDHKSYERRLERQNERLEEFASVVSHDLRNPLSVASGRLELAREECDTDHLDAVADAHDRMTELIDDLLTLAREGSDVRELESVDLGSLAESCWTNVETGDATIDIEVDRPIRADPSRLRQLVENLLRNAVEHAGDDVAITIGLLDDRAGFYVDDDGPGIPPEQRETVFEMGHSTDPDGTGFGLSIVEQVAEAHGWTVNLTDAEGGGARFEFSDVEFASE